MAIRVRENGQWKQISTNTESIPSVMTGTFVDYGPNASTTRVAGTTYTNNLGNMIQVSATIGIERQTLRDQGATLQQAKDLIAGSYLLATLTVSTSPLVTVSLANVRDNGNVNTKFLFLNPQFFVPAGLSYKIEVYDSDNNNWANNTTYTNVIETFTWTEFRLGVT